MSSYMQFHLYFLLLFKELVDQYLYNVLIFEAILPKANWTWRILDRMVKVDKI